MIAPRLAALPALAAVLALMTGCAGGLSDVKAQKSLGAPSTASASSTAEPSPSTLPPPSAVPTPAKVPDGPTRRVESSGISFEVPTRWLELKAADIAKGLGDSELLEELAGRTGLDPDQLIGMMSSIDLYLVSDEGAHQGFVDNINVVAQPGIVQNDSQIELALLALGAKNVDVRHERTDAGDAAVASYELELSGRHALASVIVVEAAEGSAAVTISTSNAQTLRHLVDVVLGSMKSSDAPVS